MLIVSSNLYLQHLLAEVAKYPSLYWIHNTEYNDDDNNEKRWKIIQLTLQDRLKDDSIEVSDMQTTLLNVKGTIARCESIHKKCVPEELKAYRYMVHKSEIPKREQSKEELTLSNYMMLRERGHSLLNIIFFVFFVGLYSGSLFDAVPLYSTATLALAIWSLLTIVLFGVREASIDVEPDQTDSFSSFFGEFVLYLIHMPIFAALVIMLNNCVKSGHSEEDCGSHYRWSIPTHWILAIATIITAILQTIIHLKKRDVPPPKTKYQGLLIVDLVTFLVLLFVAYCVGSFTYILFPVWFGANCLFVNFTFYKLSMSKATFFLYCATAPFKMITLHSKYAIDFKQKEENDHVV